jgi:E3 ubiquitin-protein ligase HUWE1
VSTQTMLALCFEQEGGLDRVFSLYSRFCDEAASILPDSSNTGEKLRLLQACGGLRIAQDLLERLSSHKGFPESSQPLRADPTDRENGETYEPHEFLIRLRAKILPVVLETWNAPWLHSAPPNVVRQVFRIIYNIVSAEGEARSDYSVVGATTTLPTLPSIFSGLRAVQVDDSAVQQLVDMGFPRSSATTALRRTNNVNMATEYLLSHPQLVTQGRQDDERSGTPAAGGEGAAASQTQTPNPAVTEDSQATSTASVQDVEMSDAPSAPASSASASESTPAATDKEKAEKDEKRQRMEETKAELDAQRSKVKDEFLFKALALAKNYPDIVFELRNAFKSFATDRSQTYGAAMALLLDNLRAHLHDDPDAAKSELRLLALLSSDEVYHVEVEFRREKVLEVVSGFVDEYLKTRPAPDKRPVWLAPLMLVIEALLSLSTVPRAAPAAAYSSDEGPSAIDQVLTGPSYESERSQWFELAMDVLSKGDHDSHTFNATMRLLLILTGQPDTAQQFVQRDGLKLLLSSCSNRESDIGQEYAILILRHVVESREVIDSIIDGEVKSLLGKQRSRPPDAASFVTAVKHAALRDPVSFLRSIYDSAKLVDPEPATGVYQIVALDDKPPPGDAASAPAPATGEPTKGEDTEMQVDEPAKPSSKEATAAVRPPGVDTAVHFLMTELLSSSSRLTAARTSQASKSTTGADTSAPAKASTEAPQATSGGSISSPTTPQEQKPDPDPVVSEMLNIRFLLACLIELLYSYVPCKTSFIYFNKRKPNEDGPSAIKPKMFFLNFILNELVPLETLYQAPDTVAITAKTVRISEWAALLIVALCSDGGSEQTRKEVPPELVTVRKLVLDAVAKAIKDASASSEPTGARYGRLCALSDLCNRLLTPAAVEPRRMRTATRSDELHVYMGKLMLEKNFAVVLTNALADVDLNFPHVENLINKILRPMQYLTKLVTRVGKSGGDRKPFTPDPLDYDEPTSSGSDSDLDSEGTGEHAGGQQEEQPDIYRTSALGMYQGELEVRRRLCRLILYIRTNTCFSLATKMITCRQAPPKSSRMKMNNWKACRMTASVCFDSLARTIGWLLTASPQCPATLAMLLTKTGRPPSTKTSWTKMRLWMNRIWKTAETISK